jgi:glucokinase
MYILAGDIGGTKTQLGVFKYQGKLLSVKEQRFNSNEYSSLTLAVEKFLKNESFKIERACFGIAGPVRDGKCKTTNLPWTVSAKEISELNSINQVYLINDLEANAHGIQCLSPYDFYVLNEGVPGQKGNAALISAGTGLGQAGLYWDGSKYHPIACEGGHCDFAPRCEKEVALFKYLKKRYDHVSYERVVSGPGIYNIYQFLVDTKIEKKVAELENDLKKSLAPQNIISEKGSTNEVELYGRVLDCFASIYGAEAGNLALKYFALSGVYLGGGIAPAIIQKLKEGPFMKAFVDKGRFSSLLKSIPVKIVLNDKAALLGAAQYAADK